MTKVNSIIAKIAIFSMVLSLVAVTGPANAANLVSIKDEMTSLTISETADHSIEFTLPTGDDFDATGGIDVIEVDFDDTSAFTMGGTWAVADFTFNDGTARTVTEVVVGDESNFTATCVDAVNNVGIAVDTTDLEIRVAPCGSSYTASATAATITLTIDGTTTDGTLTNPSSTGSYTTEILIDDEGSTDENLGSFVVPIIDDDTVTITATVDPTITFDIDTGNSGVDCSTSTCTSYDGSSVNGYAVDLRGLSTSRVNTSCDETGATPDEACPSGQNPDATDTGSINGIWLDLDTNASGGAVITVISAHAALQSASVTTDTIDSSTAVLAGGTAGYGICVTESGADGAPTPSTGDGQLIAQGAFSTTACDGDEHSVGALTTSAQPLLASRNSGDTAGAPTANARAQVRVKATISATTPTHDDYTDTLTFIATGTF